MAYKLEIPSVKTCFLPAAALLLAGKVGLQTELVQGTKTITLTTPDGTQYSGNADVTCAIFQAANDAKPECHFFSSEEVKDAVRDITTNIYDNSRTLPAEIQKWNDKIGEGTFIFDNKPSLADLALFGSVYTNGRWFSMLRQGVLTKQFTNFARQVELFQKTESDNHVVKFIQECNVYLNENKQQAKVKAKEQSKGGSFDIDLPGAIDGKVVTRFPPEPSGYLHIGHVKALLLNDYFARRFNGTMLLRFDDTNPSKEKEEYTENIMKDMKTLGVQWKGPTFTSDYIPKFYEYGRQIIQQGDAYVDNTPVDIMREERLNMIESKARQNSIEENLRLFEEMIKGSEEGLKCCVRGRLDMKSPVGCMRDPTFFRCNLTPHPRQGTKYICYPLYDFACPIIDSIEGVTHALRTIEYHDRNAQYEWVCNTLKIRAPQIWDFSRLNFEFTVLSKRKLQWFVDQNLVEGWFDPRFPTVQGILRRGLCVEALKQFMISQGASKNINLMGWDKIWAVNKKILEPKANRYNVLVSENLVPVEITDVAQATTEKTPLIPKDPSVGDKEFVKGRVIYFEQVDAKQCEVGVEVTAMNWGNLLINEIERDGDVVTKIRATTNPDGDFKKTKQKLTWIGLKDDETVKNLVPLTLTLYSHLIDIPKLVDGDKIEEHVNKNSHLTKEAVGEQAMASIKKDDVFQIQRKGLYRVDQEPCEANGNRFVLIYIPDGTAKEAVF